MKFRISASMRERLGDFRREIREALGGVSVTDANLLRPMVALMLMKDREGILDACQKASGTLRKPHNGDLDAMEAFEVEILRILGG